MAKKYSVRVTRTYPEEFVDLEIESESEEEAAQLAESDAELNEVLYFGDSPDPVFEAESDDIEEVE